jgi:hypothetical protein
MQRVECNANPFGRTVPGIERRIEKKIGAVTEHGAVFLEAPDADLGALQVTHNADIPTTFERGLTQQLSPAPMLVRLAMRKVDARDIEASLDHLAQYVRVVRRWSQRRNYFCSSQHGRDYCTSQCGSPMQKSCL